MTEKLETCRKAIEKYGIKAQVGMMHEEMCELGVALEHWKRDRCKKEDVVTEIADVMIVAAQMALYFGKEEVDAEIDRKLERLEGKMKGESEDETIRKKMIEHFKSKKKETWCNMPIKSILAYLEKQKDRKPVITGDDVAWIDDLKHDLEHPEELDEKVQEALKKRQKPAEWSAEEKGILLECVSALQNSSHWLLADKLSSLRPQPNQEWSEEDKKELKYTVSVLERCGFSDSANWLKSLPNRFSLKRTNVTVDSKLTYDENGEPELTQFEGALFSAFSDAWQEYMRGEAVNVAQWAKEHSEELLEVAKEDSVKWSDGYRKDELRTRIAFYTYKDEDGVLYLSNLFVEETSRNQGFGTKILKAAEKFAEAIGTISIRLKVKQNSPANAWYRKNGYGYMTFEDGYDWLEKTLEYLKPKQEWSEEDEKNLHHCLEIVGGWEVDYDNANPHYSTWLKSLRPQPHWKPSKEQMAVLEIACKYEGVFTQGQLSMLLDLKEQLKKL